MMDGPLRTSEIDQSILNQPPAASEEKQQAPEQLSQDFDYLDELMDMLEESNEEIEPRMGGLESAIAPSSATLGDKFLEWLYKGIHSHQLLINDSKAKIHTVKGTLFLVTPGIFQRYVKEQTGTVRAGNSTDMWRLVQREFEKLDIHQKTPNGLNIWACKVQGPRKTSSLNGYLLREVNSAVGTPTTDNPFLSLDLSTVNKM